MKTGQNNFKFHHKLFLKLVWDRSVLNKHFVFITFPLRSIIIKKGDLTEFWQCSDYSLKHVQKCPKFISGIVLNSSFHSAPVWPHKLKKFVCPSIQISTKMLRHIMLFLLYVFLALIHNPVFPGACLTPLSLGCICFNVGKN